MISPSRLSYSSLLSIVNVKLDIEMPKENFEKFKSQVVEATNGQAVFSRVDDIEYKQKCTD